MQRHHLLAIASILLGMGIVTYAVLGPLFLGVIEHHVSDGMESQVIGGDLASLMLAAPLAIASGVLWWRNHRIAPVISIGPAVYATYLYFQYITAPEYLRYDGNSEAYYPLFQSIVILGLAIAVVAWSTIDAAHIPVPKRRVQLAIAWVSLGVGVLLGLAWIRSIYDVATGETNAEYLEHPAAFWLVRTMDLSIVIPAAIVTGAGLLMRRPLAIKAAYAVTAGLTLLAASVGSMAIAMIVADDPAAEPAFAAIMIPASIAFAILTWRLWQPLLKSPTAEPASDRSIRQQSVTKTTTSVSTVRQA